MPMYILPSKTGGQIEVREMQQVLVCKKSRNRRRKITTTKTKQEHQALLKAKYCPPVAAAARAHASPQKWATLR